METLTCVIADDEPIARQILEGYIADIPYLYLVSSCSNAFEVLEALRTQSTDILFLDINMPKLSGIALLKTMQRKPHVIITTAYPEYAVEGFELSVTDYLLKPFSLERFLQSVLKVQGQRPAKVISPNTRPENTTESLFVKSDKKMAKIDLAKINHIEAYGNFIKIFADTMVLTPQTLTGFLKKLPFNFIKIHKSYILNFEELKCIDGNQAILKNGTKLPIGKSYKKIILDRIGS